MEWQPIETAPKDTDVLLYCPRRGAVRGRWDDNQYARVPRPYWSNDRERIFGSRETRIDQPTHWMRLPAPPSNAEVEPMTKAQLLAVGSTAGLSDGWAAHIAWEAVRGDENECDAEQRIANDVKAAGADMDVWWRGWFGRSDAWRDEIGFDG